MHTIWGFLLREASAAHGLHAMLAALAPYGVDAAEWAEGSVGIGARTARVEGDGAGPVLCFDRDAGLAIAADARLDDRDALCAALGVPQPDRAGLADGDLILRAYRRWGEACPHHLLGDYAFAVWDTRTHTLFCARDHIGARPLYYAETVQGFVFASAVEGVLAAPGVSDAIDEATVAQYLTGLSLLSTTRTFFESVRKLPPGHTLTVGGDTLRQGSVSSRLPVRLERYWRPEAVPRAQPASDDEYAEEFLALYAQAVQDRLHGADPVGVHLSGGLDSSSIAVLAARELRRQGRPAPLAFSWLPALGAAAPAPTYAEEYARIDAVCARAGLQVFHRALSPADFAAVLRRDGAYPGVHVHPNEEVVQQSAEELGVHVLLSGWGGDEGASFNGRGHLERLLLSGQWGKLAAECRAGGADSRHVLGCVLNLAFPGLMLDLRRLRRARSGMLAPAFRRRTPRPEPVPRHLDVRRSQVRLLQFPHLSVRIEGWAASGARRGIEYRYPLLDRRVLEFALGLPPAQFRRGRWRRWLMRQALRTVLPSEVCWHASKEDPARFEAMRAAFFGAVPAIREELAAAAPSRAGYVDMARLLESLNGDHLRTEPQVDPGIGTALQFLDWGADVANAGVAVVR